MDRAPRTFATSLTTIALLVITLLVAPASPASAATAGLWHMDESSGQMIDSSGSGNHGTLQNVTRVSPGFNGSGRAYSFNGSNSRVIVPDSSSLNPGSQNISISVHVRFSVVPPPSIGDYDLVRKNAAAGAYRMEILGSGKAFCLFKGTSGKLGKAAGSNLADGQWHTIVCRKTSSGISLTVDGSSFSKSGTVGSISSGVSLIVGGKPATGDWYNGLMDEVSIVTG